MNAAENTNLTTKSEHLMRKIELGRNKPFPKAAILSVGVSLGGAAVADNCAGRWTNVGGWQAVVDDVKVTTGTWGGDCK